MHNRFEYVPFTHIPAGDVPPPAAAMTPEEQEMHGRKLGIPPSKYHLICRHLSLAMPDLPICNLYMGWFIQRGIPRPDGLEYGIAVMSREDWIQTHGEATIPQVADSFRQHGRPLALWTYITNVDEEASYVQTPPTQPQD